VKQQVLYGGQPADVESAAGVRGILIRTIEGTMLFRVYHADRQFTDDVIYHDDLSVTIDADELVAFYAIGERRILDHSPDVLGLTSGVGRMCRRRTEIVFLVEEGPEGVYVARSTEHAIFTEAGSVEELRNQVRDAVRGHVDAGDAPALIRLRFVRDEVVAA
jgi:hypothetical protein